LQIANSNLVDANSNLVTSNVQQSVTKNTLSSNRNVHGVTKNKQSSINSYSDQIPNSISVTPGQNPIYPLSEQARQAKGDLEVLIATGSGKTKDFIGKQMSFIDLDNLSEKDILKYHRIYQSNMAIKMNDSFGKVAIKYYCHFSGLFLPINNKEKLYEDLRNYYIVVKELDRWIGWLSSILSGLMAAASTSYMTLNNCDFETNFNSA
jgi:hypothetical protein